LCGWDRSEAHHSGSQAQRACGGGGGASVLRLGERGKGEGEKWREWAAGGAAWRLREALGPVGWDPHRRTAATMPPRGVDGLKPVGHNRVQLLN
jgi:hypothetical protein